MDKKTLLIIGAVVLVVGCCVCAAAGGFIYYTTSQTVSSVASTVESVATDMPNVVTDPGSAIGVQAAQASAEVFLGFMAGEQYEMAYAVTAAEFKGEVTDADALKGIIDGAGLVIESWQWESNNELEYEGRPVIQLLGTAKYAGGLSGPVEVQLIEEDSIWKVLYFNVKGQ